MNVEERQVRDFYDQYGWVNPESAAFFNNFSRAYYPYHERVNARTIQIRYDLQQIPRDDLPRHFESCHRYRPQQTPGTRRIHPGIHFADPKPADYFDASYCAHVIYHIEKDPQHIGLRELICVAKPGGRIVVIYRNLESLPHWFLKLNRLPCFPVFGSREEGNDSLCTMPRASVTLECLYRISAVLLVRKCVS